MLELVLFDLDGTLADTAPDLAGALNRLRVERGLPTHPMAMLRPYTSQGVRGLLKAGFDIQPGHPDYESLFQRFLEIYEAHLCVETRLFDGMDQILSAIEAQGLRWGIVTNKRMRFTEPLVAALGLSARAATVVSGDTTAETKPSPLPLLHACTHVGIAPEYALYIGDDRRDIEAGKAAGMRTAAVRFGYLGDGGPIESWGADEIVDVVADLSGCIFRRQNH